MQIYAGGDIHISIEKVVDKFDVLLNGIVGQTLFFVVMLLSSGGMISTVSLHFFIIGSSLSVQLYSVIQDLFPFPLCVRAEYSCCC